MIDLTKTFSFLVTTYIAAIIVFRQNYIEVTYAIDVLLIGLFTFYMIYEDKNFKINPIIIAYTAFAIFGLASSFWATSFFSASLKSFQLFLIAINLIVLYNLMMKFDLKTSFMKGIWLGSFVNYVLSMGLITVPFALYGGSRYFGTTGNANSLAITMLVSIFLSMIYLMDVKNKKNWLYNYQYINILFALYTISLTVSKKGIIFGLVLLLLYIFISLKSKQGLTKIVVLGTTALVIFFFFVDADQVNTSVEKIIGRFIDFSEQLEGRTTEGSTGERKRLIVLGLEVLQNKPLFGYGLENFRLLSGGIYAHNNFIELLVGVGLVGFSLFYYIYLYLLTLIYKMPKSDIKILFLIFLLILLSMDMASVSYGNKLTIYMFLFFYVYIVQNIKRKEGET